MRKIQSKAMNKRGQIIQTISDNTIALMIMFFLIFAVLFGVATLNPSSFFPTGTALQNASVTAVQNLQANLTDGTAQVGAYIPTSFKILGVVLALGAIGLLIVVVGRMRQSAGGGIGL